MVLTGVNKEMKWNEMKWATFAPVQTEKSCEVR